MNGRTAAFQAVLAALCGGGFVHDTLARLRASGGLAGREAALAMEIALGSLRHLVTIEQVLGKLARYDPRRVKPDIRAILLTGAFQIIWMDRVPDFAAVDETVRLARRRTKGRAAGMVNAVLRNLTRAVDTRSAPWTRLNPRQIRTGWERACAFNSDVLPAPGNDRTKIEHLAAAAGEHLSRMRTLVNRHGEDRAEAVAWALQAVPPTVLQRNTLRINSGVFEARIRQELGPQVEWTPEGVFAPPYVNVIDAPLFQEGRAYIQDTTARSAALLLDARRGETILDLCAAPGGKTVVIAQQIGDYGEVLACDVAPERVRRIAENARRMRLSSIRTHLIDAADGVEALARDFNAVLVDVPCTNSGVVARRPEARLGFTRKKLDSLTSLQAILLRQAAARVRLGGRLVYSTCSIEPEENENIISAFIDENPRWRRLLVRTTLPQWGPRPSNWRDGGFAALLVHNPSRYSFSPH